LHLSISPGEFAALGCAFLWAIDGLILRTQSARISPAAMNVVRCSMAGIVYWALLPFGAPLAALVQVPLHAWGLLLAAVIIGSVFGETLYLTSIREIGISRTMVLVSITPLTTLFWESLLLLQPVTRTLIAGCGLVAVGVAFLSRQPSSRSIPEGDVPVRLKFGVLLSLSAALLWGLSSVLLKPALSHFTLVQISAVRMPLVAFILYFFRVRSTPGGWPPERRVFLVVASSGLIGLSLGAYLFLYGIDHIGATRTITLTSAAPLFSVTMAVIFIKEKITFRVVLGMACCMAGVWAVL